MTDTPALGEAGSMCPACKYVYEEFGKGGWASSRDATHDDLCCGLTDKDECPWPGECVTHDERSGQ